MQKSLSITSQLNSNHWIDQLLLQPTQKYGVLNYEVVKQLLVDFEKGINFSNVVL